MRAIRVVLLVVWVAVVVAMAGCSEEPSAPREPRPEVRVPTVVRTTVPALCEKNYMWLTDGDWEGTYEWLPSGAPTGTDDVCISGVGTYTITLGTRSLADSIYIGPGVNVTFISPPDGDGELLGAEELVVDAGASLTIASDASVSTHALINDGSVIVRDMASFHFVDSLHNRSYLELSTAGVTSATRLTNVGDLYTTTASDLHVLTHAELAAGRVLGPGTMRFSGTPVTSRFVWSGGQLGTRSRASDAAQVSVSAGTVELANTALSGALDIVFANTLIGDVGAGVNLKLLFAGSLWMTNSGASTTPLVNEGTFLLEGPPSLTHLESTRPFENRAELGVLSGTMDVSTASFVNRGTVNVKPSAMLEVGGTRATNLRNEGTITVASGGNWTLRDGEFQTSPGGVHTGQFAISGGRLTGNGQLDQVRSTGGRIAPGPGIATLTFNALELNSASRVQMDVSGPAVFDRIRVAGKATYGGLLEVNVLGGYQGGVCGQLLPMFTDRNSLTGSTPGRFQNFAHLPAALGKYWRAHYPRDSVIVAGYDPTAYVTVTPISGTLVEGGASRTGQLCLNLPVTGADVLAQLSAARNQFTVTPTLTFTSSNFALPQQLQYTAVDDAASEGPHHDTLRVALTQGGAPFGGATPAPTFSIVDNDPGVDLTVSLVSNDPEAPGILIDRRFRVTNIGPGASTGSTFTIPALSGITFSSNGSGASCTSTAGTLTCSVGALASGSSAEFVVVFTAPAVAGVYSNTLRIRGNDWDNVSANNSVPWTLTVQ